MKTKKLRYLIARARVCVYLSACLSVGLTSIKTHTKKKVEKINDVSKPRPDPNG